MGGGDCHTLKVKMARNTDQLLMHSLNAHLGNIIHVFLIFKVHFGFLTVQLCGRMADY